MRYAEILKNWLKESFMLTGDTRYTQRHAWDTVFGPFVYWGVLPHSIKNKPPIGGLDQFSVNT
jgi:hypothetical protein